MIRIILLYINAAIFMWTKGGMLSIE